MNFNKLNDIKDDWKIPDAKLTVRNRDWTDSDINPFPLILRKSYAKDGNYITEAIVFNDSRSARHLSCKASEIAIKNKNFRFSYSDWDIRTGNLENIEITTVEILNLLDLGFKWINIDETVEWFTDIFEGKIYPCWLY